MSDNIVQKSVAQHAKDIRKVCNKCGTYPEELIMAMAKKTWKEEQESTE